VDKYKLRKITSNEKQSSPTNPDSVDYEDITDELASAYEEAIAGLNDPNSENVIFRLRNFGDIDVKKIRTAAKLTQSNLALLMDVNLSTVQHWEQGTRQPKSTSRIVLNAIANAARSNNEVDNRERA